MFTVQRMSVHEPFSSCPVFGCEPAGEALRTTVTVGFSVGQDGVPDAGSIALVESNGESDTATRQAYEAARRAIIRCGARGFPLPQDKYEQWKNIEIVFDPNGMRMR